MAEPVKGDVIKYLQGQSDVTRLVDRTAIRPNKASRTDPRPYVAVRQSGALADYHLRAESDLTQTRLEIRIEHTTFKQASILAKKIKNRMSGFQGTMGSSSVRLSRIVDWVDDENAPAAGSTDKGYPAVVMEWAIHHTETVTEHL